MPARIEFPSSSQGRPCDSLLGRAVPATSYRRDREKRQIATAKPIDAASSWGPDRASFDPEGDNHGNRNQLKRNASCRVLQGEMQQLPANGDLGVKARDHLAKDIAAPS